MKHPGVALRTNGRSGRGDYGKELEADDTCESPEIVLRSILNVGCFSLCFFSFGIFFLYV